MDTSDATAFTVTATAALPAGGIGFVEADPATGNVWVGSGNSVLVFDPAARQVATISGPDEAVDVTFDTTTGRAFVVWQDNGDTGSGGDQTSSLAVYDTATFAPAAAPVTLEGNQSQLGDACVAVTRGGTSVYVSSPAESKITKLGLRMSPKVTQAPTDLGGPTGGTTPDTSGGTGAGGTGTTTTPAATAGGSLASTGATIGTAAGVALLLTATGWYLRRRARTTAGGQIRTPGSELYPDS
ncbi:hypothetical protein AB0J81_08285 [Streptomyces bobili]|uniref:hypothetical protein n=1 Tax=Streptomyces bobili TaxID=67280 RepID=UPI00343AD981